MMLMMMLLMIMIALMIIYDSFNDYDNIRYDDGDDDAVDDNDSFYDNHDIIFYVKATGEGALSSRKV